MINFTAFSENPFDTQRILLQDLGETDITIFDVGANWGQTTQKYRTLFPKAMIYSFEPFPDSIKKMNDKFASDQKIRIIPKAVADNEGERMFYVNEFDPTNSLFPRPRTERRYYPRTAGNKGIIKVDVITLDKFVASEKIDKMTVLKLDIQGGEMMALKGANSLLREQRVSLIYTECMFVHHYEQSPLFFEVWNYLAKLEYTLFNIYDLHRATNGQIRYGDALFVSPFIRENVINKYPDEP